MAIRNTLSDKEVAVIKNLLKKKVKNSEIAGLINRARGDASKDISTGRISNIKNKQIAKYLPIKAAKDEEVEEFFRERLNLVENTIITEEGPLSERQLSRILPVKSVSPKIKLDITETDQIECKVSFNLPPKTLAALANNKGGYIICGVQDQTWEVIGLTAEKLEAFINFDWKDKNAKILSQLGADLEIQKTTRIIEGKTIGIVYIRPAKIKPLIIVNGDSETSFGQIYYRYPGEDRLISPHDLQILIEDRIRQLTETSLSKHIQNIFRFGIENTAIMNVDSGEVSGPSGNFIIDEALLPKLTFIKEGNFTQNDGAPTLKLMGNLTSVNKVAVVTDVAAISSNLLMKHFVEQTEVSNPNIYIAHLADAQATWLPIFYYLKLAGLSANDGIKIMDDSGGRADRIAPQKQRILGQKHVEGQGSKAGFTGEIEAIGKGIMPAGDKASISRYFRAILLLEKGDIKQVFAFKFLQQYYDEFYLSSNGNDKSMYRLAASKIDELFFQ